MKKYIANKLYDTDTAKKLAEWDNGLYVNDLGYVGQSLYRRRGGTFFLHSEGGANTRYAQRESGGGWVGGEAIEPVSVTEARTWAEAHLDASEVEAIFEGDEARFVTFELSAKARARIDALVEQTGKSRSQVIEDLLVG